MPLELRDKSYPIVTLDFETYYDTDFTLRTLSTSEYIRDPRFHAHGVGIKYEEQATQWYTGKNIRLILNEIDWSKTAMLAYNTPFDGFICSHHFGVHPVVYLDVLAMVRGTHGHHMRHDLDTIARIHGLGGKTKRSALADTKGKLILTAAESAALGGYCKDDCDDTHALFWKLYPNLTDDELRLIHITTRMFCQPRLLVDIPRVQAELDREISGKIAVRMICGATAEELMSDIKFGALLSAAGAALPMKVSPSTGKIVATFAKSNVAFQKLLNSSNKRVADLCNARVKLKSTGGETRAMRFLQAGKDGNALPVLLLYCGAHTTRWSGGNKMNMQNLKRGGELRKSIIAPKKHVIVVADSAQIEARTCAWLARQDNVVQAFANGRDLYSECATLIYGRTINRKRAAKNDQGKFLDEAGNVVASYDEAFKPDALEGFVGKVCILGLGYGMGPDKLQITLEQGIMGPPVFLDLEFCKRIVAIYRANNPFIVELWRAMDEILACMIMGTEGTFGPITYGKNYIQLPSGLFLQYHGLEGELTERKGRVIAVDASYMTRKGRSKIYGGALTENVTQALARCIVGEQMLEIDDRWPVMTMSHDEIVSLAPAKRGQECLDDMIRVMSKAPAWAPGLPLKAEGGFAVNYSK